jgi:diguanylate cyclase (GGDEF)-like protein
VRGGDTEARMGGDELVMLLLGLDHLEQCQVALEPILESLNRPVDIDGLSATISASIGVALYPQDDSDADALLRHADITMYQGKRLAKNSYHLAEIQGGVGGRRHYATPCATIRPRVPSSASSA